VYDDASSAALRLSSVTAGTQLTQMSFSDSHPSAGFALNTWLHSEHTLFSHFPQLFLRRFVSNSISQQLHFPINTGKQPEHTVRGSGQSYPSSWNLPLHDGHTAFPHSTHDPALAKSPNGLVQSSQLDLMFAPAPGSPPRGRAMTAPNLPVKRAGRAAITVAVLAGSMRSTAPAGPVEPRAGVET